MDAVAVPVGGNANLDGVVTTHGRLVEDTGASLGAVHEDECFVGGMGTDNRCGVVNPDLLAPCIEYVAFPIRPPVHRLEGHVEGFPVDGVVGQLAEVAGVAFGGRVLAGHKLHLAFHHIMPLLDGLTFLARVTEDVLRLVAALCLGGGGQQDGAQGEEG